MLPRLWLELLAVVGLATLVLTMLAQGRELAMIMPMLGLFAAAAFRLLPSVNRTLAAAQALRYSLPAVNTVYDEFKLGSPESARDHQRGRTVRTYGCGTGCSRRAQKGKAYPQINGLTDTLCKEITLIGERLGVPLLANHVPPFISSISILPLSATSAIR